MEKLVYVLWKADGVDALRFNEAMLGPVAERLIDAGADKLSMNVVDAGVAHAAAVRITTMESPIAATVSLWIDNSDDRGPCESILSEASDRVAGYLVVESVPLRNTTHKAPLGERIPGVNLVSCIEKPDRLSMEAWLDHWQGHHKRVALEVQCTYSYTRNAVVRALTPDAPAWAGIVEEGFPSDAVVDPMLWYCANGSKEKLEENFGRMMESVQAFLDVERVESHPMSEYCIKD